MIRLRDVATAMAISLLAIGPAVAATGAGVSHSGMSSSEVKDVQQALKSQGLYQQGQVDGRYGPGTRSALEQFQQQHNLTANGRLDHQTLAALGVQGGQQGMSGSSGEQGGASGSGMTGMSSGTSNSQENGSTNGTASTSTSSGVGTSMATGNAAGTQPSGTTITGGGGNGAGGGGAGAGSGH